MRLIKGVALLALLATAACSVGATGLVVTLQIGGGGEAQNLSIDLIKVAPTGDVPLAGGTFKYAHRVENGDVFSVLLADDDDGQSVKVQIKGTVLDSCGSAAEAHDAKEVMVIKHQALPVTLSLTAPVAGCADGGVDMAHDSGPADLTSSRDSSDLPDLSVLDLTMPPPPDLTALLDLTPLPDLTMLPDFTPLPDLTPVDLIASPDLTCTPSCQAGVATMCVGNQPKTQTCAYGCKGTSCDPTCAAAGDISAGGTFTADTTYGTDQNAGSCNVGMGGREDVLAFTLADWSTVILTMNSIKAPELYVRQRCGDPTSDQA